MKRKRVKYKQRLDKSMIIYCF